MIGKIVVMAALVGFTAMQMSEVGRALVAHLLGVNFRWMHDGWGWWIKFQAKPTEERLIAQAGLAVCMAVTGLGLFAAMRLDALGWIGLPFYLIAPAYSLALRSLARQACVQWRKCSPEVRFRRTLAALFLKQLPRPMAKALVRSVRGVQERSVQARDMFLFAFDR